MFDPFGIFPFRSSEWSLNPPASLPQDGSGPYGGIKRMVIKMLVGTRARVGPGCPIQLVKPYTGDGLKRSNVAVRSSVEKILRIVLARKTRYHIWVSIPFPFLLPSTCIKIFFKVCFQILFRLFAMRAVPMLPEVAVGKNLKYDPAILYSRKKN